ncbi:MAG: hypothetical protein KatS3mg060_1525 [Dehalococcoidia bacterium]|nr:MAG: hypothetical protein KatS3mg060_1525 [Dehalococcoidia bacterium]
MISAAAVAAQLPDRPWLVFLRWCLATGRAHVVAFREEASGPVAVVRLDPQGTVWAVGAVTSDELCRAVRGERGVAEVRADEMAMGSARVACRGWFETAAIVHERPPGPLPPYDARGVRLMATADDRRAVDRLSYRLRAAAFFASPQLPVALCFDDIEVISVATFYAETARYGEVSIDTVRWRRRQGHGFRTAAFLLEHGLPPQKWAVWTAEAHNEASVQLAARLGFRPVERFTLLRPRPPVDEGERAE